MTDMLAQALPWMAVIAILLAAAVAIAVLAARSLFGVAIAIAPLCACAAAAMLANGHGEAALAVALLGVGVAPTLLLGAMLLSNRAVKPRTRGLPWFSIAAAGAAGAAMLWAAPTLDLPHPVAAPHDGMPVAVAAIVFVALAACIALLGYGERGVLGDLRKGRGG